MERTEELQGPSHDYQQAMADKRADLRRELRAIRLIVRGFKMLKDGTEVRRVLNYVNDRYTLNR